VPWATASAPGLLQIADDFGGTATAEGSVSLKPHLTAPVPVAKGGNWAGDSGRGV